MRPTIQPLMTLLASVTLCFSAIAQMPGPTNNQPSPYAAIQNTDQQVRSFLNSANVYAANKPELKTVKTDISKISTTTAAQQELEDELTRFSTAINGIDQFKKDLKNLDVQISLINNGITSLKIVSPTSNFLGESFADILMKNALDILGNDVGNANQRSKFQKILGLVVTNPIVSTVFNSNPITSMCREAVSHAINISDGKISKATIDKFNNSIAPYLEFYASIDKAADELQQNLVAISLAINKKQSKMNRLEVSIAEVLDKYSGKTNRDKLRNMLQVSQASKMTVQQVRDLLSKRDVRMLDQLIERQMFVVDDFIDDPLALQISYNEYIEKMKMILETAKSTSALSFDPNKVQEAIRQYKPI